MSAYDDRSMSLAVERIYDAALEPSGWEKATAAFGDALGGESLFVVVDPKRQQTPLITFNGLDASLRPAFYDHFAKINPYSGAYANQPIGKVVWAGEVITREEVEQTEFYNDFMRPAGLNPHFPSIKLIQRDDLYAGLSINPGWRPLNGKIGWYEARMLRLARHFTNALEINGLVQHSKLANRMLEQSLEAISGAAFLLDEKRRLLHANRRGENLLRSERLLLTDRGGELRAWRPADDARLAKYLIPDPEVAEQPLKLRSSASGRSYVAWRVPLVPATQPITALRQELVEHFLPRARTLLVVVPLVSSRKVRAELIRDVFGLTLAEARLARALVGGLSISDYAREAVVSEKTARNQLASIFLKTGTARQSDLAVLVIGALSLFEE